jgi:hypothetical protein
LELLISGEELTPKELNTLKEKDPVAYQAEMDRRQSAEAYKRKLSSAKTKEEFQRIRTEQVQANFTRFNSVKNDSAIPEGAKLAIYEDITTRVKAEQSIEQKFMKSGEYDALPTEEEKAEAEKAARDEIRGEDKSQKTESEKTDPTKETDSGKKTDPTRQADKVKISDSTRQADSDQTDESGRTPSIPDSSKSDKEIVSSGKAADQPADRLKTRADRLLSELSRKSDAELEEIRRKVERANQQRNKFSQSESVHQMEKHIFTKA